MRGRAECVEVVHHAFGARKVRGLLEREELVEHFRGGNGRLQEGALFAAVLREVLENLVEFCLFVLVDVQEESAELVFKVVHATKVIVAALFV